MGGGGEQGGSGRKSHLCGGLQTFFLAPVSCLPWSPGARRLVEERKRIPEQMVSVDGCSEHQTVRDGETRSFKAQKSND